MEEAGRPRLSSAGPRGSCRPSESSGAAEEFATEGGGGLREEEAEEAEEEGRKMAAVELEWIPETLYNTAISAVVDNYIRSRRDIRSLPENIQFDVYYKVRTVGLFPALLPQPWGRTPFHVCEAPRLTPHPSEQDRLPRHLVWPRGCQDRNILPPGPVSQVLGPRLVSS